MMTEVEIHHYFINENGQFREISMSEIFDCLEISSNQLFEYGNLEFMCIPLFCPQKNTLWDGI